jgi:hypothetical protein
LVHCSGKLYDRAAVVGLGPVGLHLDMKNKFLKTAGQIGITKSHQKINKSKPVKIPI